MIDNHPVRYRRGHSYKTCNPAINTSDDRAGPSSVASPRNDPFEDFVVGSRSFLRGEFAIIIRLVQRSRGGGNESSGIWQSRRARGWRLARMGKNYSVPETWRLREKFTFIMFCQDVNFSYGKPAGNDRRAVLCVCVCEFKNDYILPAESCENCYAECGSPVNVPHTIRAELNDPREIPFN